MKPSLETEAEFVLLRRFQQRTSCYINIMGIADSTPFYSVNQERNNYLL
jgi:hypothetical protein